MHRDPQCVALAERRRAFPRALRLDGPLDVTPVREHLAALEAAGQEHGTTPEPARTAPRAARQDHDERADESRQTREQHAMSQPT